MATMSRQFCKIALLLVDGPQCETKSKGCRLTTSRFWLAVVMGGLSCRDVMAAMAVCRDDKSWPFCRAGWVEVGKVGRCL